MADKLSDEQIAEWWADSFKADCTERWSQPMRFAMHAYRAGQEAMREEAAKVCDEAAELNQWEYSKSPNSYAEGASDIADELAQTIRDLPVSEE